MKDVKKGKPALKPLPKKVEEKRRIGLNNSAIRERLATTRPEHRSDIGSIWTEQNRLARQRKKGEKTTKSAFQFLKMQLKKITTELTPHFYKVKKIVRQKWTHYSKKQQKKIKIASSLGLIVFAVVIAKSAISSNSSPKSLGAQTGISSTPQDGRTDEAPDFSPLKPLGREDAVQSVTRRTPSGEIIHTFKDIVDEIGIEVTQQKIPEKFKENQADSLKEMATTFQATNIIQIDEMIVYHGLNEKTNVQSLFFIKNESLVSIRASQKISDDSWSGYILSLQ